MKVKATRLAQSIFLFAALNVMAAGIAAEETPLTDRTPPGAPPTRRAAYWASDDRLTQVILVQYPSEFRLIVIGEPDLTVAYCTSINSGPVLSEELQPIQPTAKGIREFKFKAHHIFSRMSIWMAIEFRRNGKLIDGLTRTFYGSIDTVVENQKFLGKEWVEWGQIFPLDN